MSNIRNFCIISHIDHGKSTLADRLLEITKSVEERKMHSQFLDRMELEQEKGITIKLQPVKMKYDFNGQEYILNLIDTPGHADFSYEVSRSLKAVDGALLLIDDAQGIQAQTLANLYLAQEQNLKIIPVVNKIDLPNAQVEKTVSEIKKLFEEDVDPILISAKKGTNIEEILKAVIEEFPDPQGEINDNLRALIFDSEYDSYKGVIAYVKVVDGSLSTGQQISMLASEAEAETKEVGFFSPDLVVARKIQAGDIGYIATGLKDIGNCRVGDTLTLTSQKEKTQPLAGYQEPKPMVFVSFYPIDGQDFDVLKTALSKLRLNDASLFFELESSDALGRGFRCGFLGMLHLEIISERLKREYSLDLVITTPSVSYDLDEMTEPWTELKIITPNDYLGPVMNLLSDTDGGFQATDYLSQEKVLLTYHLPLREIVVDFYDKLKSATSGYASMFYEPIGYRSADLVKLDILVAGEPVEAFSEIVPRHKAEEKGRAMVKKLKDVIPPHLFSVPLQAAIGGKIIAREDIRALRKDVTGHLYGGDVTRKRKLLEKQKKGKRKMKSFGRVNIPQEAFLKALKK